MRVIHTQVKKIRIEDVNLSHRLDPVEVIIENYPGTTAGKIVITCWGKSWTGFWGSMGSTLEKFFQRVDNDYLIRCMSDYAPTVEDRDSDADFIKGIILNERRRGCITSEEAREAYWYVDSFSPDRASLVSHMPPQLAMLDGMQEPWYLDWPSQANPDYAYLSRILDLVREVIKPEVTNEKA